MSGSGPLLEQLTRHLAECPPDFLAEPRLGTRGVVRVDAVVSDLMEALGGKPLSITRAKAFSPESSTAKVRRNRLRLVLVACRLLHHHWFREAAQAAGNDSLAGPALDWLAKGLDELSALVAADLFVTDPERREELARLCLAALDLLPRGENKAQAEDRLRTVSAVERKRVVQEAKAREEHARKVREAMEAKKAREAAAKWHGE